MRTAQDLGIQIVEVPFVYRLNRLIGRAALSLSRAPLQGFFEGSLGIALYVLVTSRFWTLTGDPAFYAALVALIVALGVALNFVNKATSSLYVRLMFGSPLLGNLGTSLPRGIVFTALRSAREVKFRFSPSDLETVNRFLVLDHEITMESVKILYRDNRLLEVRTKHWSEKDVKEWMPQEFLDEMAEIIHLPPDATAEAIQDLPRPEIFALLLQPDDEDVPQVELTDKFEADWAQLWERIRSMRSGEVTYSDAVDTDNISFRVTWPVIAGVTTVLVPLLMVGQLAVITALIFYLSNDIALVTVIQVGALVTAVVAITYFIHHLYALTELPFAFISVSPEIQKRFGERIDAFDGIKVTPAGPVQVGRKYFMIVRGYLLRITPITFLTSFNMIILAGICAGLGAIWLSDESRFIPWYRDLAIGLLLIPIFFTVGASIMFWLIENFKLIFAFVFFGLLTLITPYVISYMTGGSDMDRTVEQIVAGLSTTVVVITTAITTLLSRRMEQPEGNAT